MVLEQRGSQLWALQVPCVLGVPATTIPTRSSTSVACTSCPTRAASAIISSSCTAVAFVSASTLLPTRLQQWDTKRHRLRGMPLVV